MASELSEEEDAPNAFTELALSGFGVTPYSARGLTQSLEPIDAAQSLRRTINGGLLDLSAAQFRKYKSTISGNDMRPPSIAGVWPGRVVTVDCISELSYPTDTGSAERTVVPGSVYDEEGFTFYRPRLNMRVINFTTQRDEYGAITSWSMSLEEA